MRRPRVSMDLYAGFRHSFLGYGPPGAGKTNWESLVALVFPGAAFISSTRADIADNTVMARSRGGYPVWWLNPRLAGGFPCNLRFSPLTGCRDYEVAMENAGALIHAAPRNGDGSSNWIDAESKRFLQFLMHAAAHGGYDIRAVRRWAATPADVTAPMEILYAAGNPDWAHQLDAMSARAEADPQFCEGLSGGTEGALAWLDDLVLADLACPPPGEEFDIRQFIRSRGTVYVIAADSPNCTVSPYVACLATAIWNTAKEMAGDPSEPAACNLRLDPPLLMLIDEPDAGCPVPVGDWARTAGGDGAVMVTGYQSDAQPRRRDGDHGGQVLEDCFTVKLVFRGGTGPIYGKAAEWGGKHDTWNWVKNTDGSRTRQPGETETFSRQRIGNMDEGQVFVKVNGCRGFIAEVGLVTDHPLYEPPDPDLFWDVPPKTPEQDAIAVLFLYLMLIRAASRQPLVRRRALRAPPAFPALTRGEVPSSPHSPTTVSR